MLKTIMNFIIFGLSGFAGAMTYSQVYVPWKKRKDTERQKQTELFEYVKKRGVTVQEFINLVAEISSVESNPSSSSIPLYSASKFSMYELRQFIETPTLLNSTLAAYVLRLLFNTSDSSRMKKRKSEIFYDFAEYVKSNDTKSEEGVTIPHVV